MDITVLDREMIESLKAEALADKKKRSRITFSKPTDAVQEMVIALHRHSYIRPHRHPFFKSESYHVIEGELDVLLFKPNGDYERTIRLNDKTPFYRMTNGWYHQPMSVSDFSVYHETYWGPFHKDEDVRYAEWSAPETQ